MPGSNDHGRRLERPGQRKKRLPGAQQSEAAEARFGIKETPDRRSRPDRYTGALGPARHLAMLEAGFRHTAFRRHSCPR